MQLPVSIVQLPLLLLPLFSNLIIATPAPAPIPIPATTDYGNGPIKLPKFSSGTAVQDPGDSIRAFYQFDDGAIHELDGTGDPAKNTYTDQITLKPGLAKYGSPLASVDLSGSGNIRLYYINPYNQLKELVRLADGEAWFSGELDESSIYVKPDSQVLWAVSSFNEYNILVGYVSPTGVFSGAYHHNDDGWTTTPF